MSKYLFFQILFVLGILFSVAPVPVEAAGIIPCGRSSGSTEEQAPCTVCHIVVAGNNVIKWGTGIMGVIAVTVLFAMAVLYVVSAGDEGMMKTAKGGIWAALIGFTVMLSAWLIVNTVLSVLADTTTTGAPLAGLVQSGKFVYSCDTASNVAR